MAKIARPPVNPEMVDAFFTEIVDRESLIDPSGELDWFALSIGWAIAKGMEPADSADEIGEAFNFALHVRYDLQYERRFLERWRAAEEMVRRATT